MSGVIMTKKELVRFLGNDVWVSIDRLEDKASPKKQKQWSECISHLEKLIAELDKI
ncbi:hypothetical protein [Halomonas sp. QHL1]|uniref:hypothetical protein n=1 Tax=Halomonas sp. QHL1 TaxID=1123773 RepID=UPI000B06BC19|nr:hypothetical protein [Halomonas sp. QHL1]